MSFTQTWSFGSGFDGWSFVDESTASAFATRTHVSGAIRTTLHYDNVGGARTAIGNHKSAIGLNAAIVNNDTIELDYGSSSDGQIVRIFLTAFYTDETTETTNVVNTGTATLTLTMTVSKTLDFIEIILLIGDTNPGTRTTNRDILEVRLITATELTPTAGKLRTPVEFIDEEGDGAAGGAGGGAGGNPACISANSFYIYIASFNNLGFPELIRMPAALDADGSVVFTPGVGGRIGVKCGKFNTDHVWVAGQFDSTNTVEKSEDAGGSFTVKDDGTFGTIRTFEVGPANDETVLIFDGDNSDIIETTDDGATWTTINAATAVLLNSLTRFSQNPEEIASTNVAGAVNGAFYSVNTGVDLEDIQAAPYPNAEGTKVIAT